MSEGLNLLLRNYPPVLHDKPGNTYLEYYTGGERHIMRLNAHKKRLSQREFAALVRVRDGEGADRRYAAHMVCRKDEGAAPGHDEELQFVRLDFRVETP